MKTTNTTCQSRNKINQHVSDDNVIKKGQVVVKEIGSHSDIGGYHLLMI